MAKVYTAQEMRAMADKEKFKCSFVTRTLNGGIILDCTNDVRAMLRQAADMMERETAKDAETERLRDMIEELTDALHPFREWFDNQKLIDRAKEMIGLKEIGGVK